MAPNQPELIPDIDRAHYFETSPQVRITPATAKLRAER